MAHHVLELGKDLLDGINPALMGLPADALAGDVRPILLHWQDRFFEAEPLGAHEKPDHADVRLDTTPGQFRSARSRRSSE